MESGQTEREREGESERGKERERSAHMGFYICVGPCCDGVSGVSSERL